MTLVLARVDDRLIHGQVAVGLRATTGFDRILVADADAAADGWERDLLTAAAPPGVSVEVVAPEAAAGRIEDSVSKRVLLLVRSPASMLAVLRGGAPVTEVNLGGLHARGGARRYLDFLYLTPEDIGALKELAEAGVVLLAQDLPGHPARELNRPLVEGRLAFDQLPAGDP